MTPASASPRAPAAPRATGGRTRPRRGRRSRTSRRRARSAGRRAGRPRAQNSSRLRLGLPVEPVVVRPARRARAPAPRGMPCSSTASSAWISFQTSTTLGDLVHEALVRQVVPAEDGIGAVQPEPLRRPHVVGLDGVAREVGDEDDVGLEVGEEALDVRRRLEAALDRLDESGAPRHRARPTARAACDGAADPAHHGVRRCLARARAARAPPRSGLEVAEVVGVHTQPPGQGAPADRILRSQPGLRRAREAAEGERAASRRRAAGAPCGPPA